MENILKKASELGHLLNQNEIVIRFHELSEKLSKSEASKELLEKLLKASQEFERKEKGGETIEVQEKRDLSELQEEAKNDSLISEYLATQVYYMNILAQVNEAIANPKGDPPKDSNIILPGDSDKGIIIT